MESTSPSSTARRGGCRVDDGDWRADRTLSRPKFGVSCDAGQALAERDWTLEGGPGSTPSAEYSNSSETTTTAGE